MPTGKCLKLLRQENLKVYLAWLFYALSPGISAYCCVDRRGHKSCCVHSLKEQACEYTNKKEKKIVLC